MHHRRQRHIAEAPLVSRRRFLGGAALAFGAAAVAPALPSALGRPLATALTSHHPGAGDARARVTSGLTPPPIITRAAWGANESRRTRTPRFSPLETIVVHHTASPWSGDSAADVRTIYRQHLERENGRWGDIGYHFLIDPEGRTYEGRWARDYSPGEPHDGHDLEGRLVHGVHAEGLNWRTAGISMIGDFRWERPTIKAQAALVEAVAWLCDRHGLDPLATAGSTDTSGLWRAWPTIVGHRDAGGTECPGRAAYELVPHLRQWVSDRLQGSPGTPA